jgi:hypothetical protein
MQAEDMTSHLNGGGPTRLALSHRMLSVMPKMVAVATIHIINSTNIVNF